MRNTKKPSTYWQKQSRSIACFSVDLSRNVNTQKISLLLFMFINSLINYSHGNQIIVFQFQIISVNVLPLFLLCLSLKLTWRCYQSLQTLKYATAGQLKINRWSVQLLPWRSPQFPGGHRSACLIWPNAHPPIYPGLWPPVDGFVFPHSLKPEILHVKGKFVNHYTKKPPGHLKETPYCSSYCRSGSLTSYLVDDVDAVINLLASENRVEVMEPVL